VLLRCLYLFEQFSCELIFNAIELLKVIMTKLRILVKMSIALLILMLRTLFIIPVVSGVGLLIILKLHKILKYRFLLLSFLNHYEFKFGVIVVVFG
jgi:hypothetical protein